MPTASVALNLLGPLEVRLDGRALPITSRRQRALLAALALRPGESLSADRLIDALWGERPPATAAKALQVQVSQLRRLLEAPGSGAAAARVLGTRNGGHALGGEARHLRAPPVPRPPPPGPAAR